MVKKKISEVETIAQYFGKPNGSTLKMGLVGLPNVGKSSTFNILSNMGVPAENFPFCTIAPHEARLPVPDYRFKWLTDKFKPKNQIAAFLSITDIAGLVKGAHLGEGLGNAFLSNIMGVDGLYHVVRAFKGDEVVHVEGSINPIRDIEIINDELRLKDLSRLLSVKENCVKKHEKMKRTKESSDEENCIDKAIECLQNKMWIKHYEWNQSDVEILSKFNLLTCKPVVYLLNVSKAAYEKFLKMDSNQKPKSLTAILDYIEQCNKGPVIIYSIEYENFNLNDKTVKSAIPDIIHRGFSCLNLINFFTVGPDEVRAWTIRDGMKAPQAAGVIHTDFERGFICADVYKYEDIVELGDENQVKISGKMLQKGKEYIMASGDIVHFKFNVTNKPKK